MNWKLLLLTILAMAIFSGVIISGCVERPNDQNESTSISTPTQKYDDDKFVDIIKEAYSVMENDKSQLMTAIEKRDFKNIEKYSKSLESDSAKYISMIEDLTVSPKLEGMYSKYYNFLEGMNKIGRYFQESVKKHKSMNITIGSCDNPYTYDELM